MISCITLKTAHLFRGNPIASMLQLRFRAVIERQEWDVPNWQNMEYDEFDNPATTYFVWRDGDDAVGGCARLYPTDRPYMLKKAFSFLVTDGTLPESDMTIWEGSRLCVEKDLPAPLRKRIIYELSVAYMEYAMSNVSVQPGPPVKIPWICYTIPIEQPSGQSESVHSLMSGHGDDRDIGRIAPYRSE
jgi:N-acyl-L-homoserine lactone synthetase